MKHGAVGRNRRLLGIVAIVGVATLLAACQKKEVAGPPILNGSWASSDGVYVANFLNGSFRAVANDTGNVISEGEYLALSADRVQIKWTGLITGTASEAECTKPEVNRLDCVNSNGNRFSLIRT